MNFALDGNVLSQFALVLSYLSLLSSEVTKFGAQFLQRRVYQLLWKGCLQAVVLGSVPCGNCTTKSRQKPRHLLLILELLNTYDASICRCPSNFGISLARLQPEIVDDRWNCCRSFDGCNSCHPSLEYILYITWCFLPQRYSCDQGLTRF